MRFIYLTLSCRKIKLSLLKLNEEQNMIVLTGGAGFIGSAIIAKLNKKGINDILVVDELQTDHRWKNLRKLSYADYMEKDDFLETVEENKLEGIKSVIHMGACSSTTEKDASFLVKNNFEYTKKLATWSLMQGARFIYASSAATYGDGEQGFRDDESKIEKLVPLNMYGYSKQMFDLWASKKGVLGQIVGLKYFNVYGPNEYHKGSMRSFILKAFEQIKETGKVKLFKSHRPEYKDGEQLRDFVYVKDAVDMTLFFLEHKNIGGLYNVGTGKARNWNDLVNATFAALDKEPNIEYIPMPESIRDQYQYYTQAEISKIRKAGYDKETWTLEDAIKDYVQNYLTKGEYLSGI